MELVSNGTRSSLDGPFHGNFRKFLVNGKFPQFSCSLSQMHSLHTLSGRARLRIQPPLLAPRSSPLGTFHRKDDVSSVKRPWQQGARSEERRLYSQAMSRLGFKGEQVHCLKRWVSVVLKTIDRAIFV